MADARFEDDHETQTQLQSRGLDDPVSGVHFGAFFFAPKKDVFVVPTTTTIS